MRAWLTAVVTLAWPATLAFAAPPPISSFTDFAKFESMKISPKGTYVAFTRRTSEHEVITVLRLSDLKPTTQSHFGDWIDIWSFEWASDSRLLIQPTRRFPGFIDYKAPTGEIIGLDADGKGAELLFGPVAGKMQTGTRTEQRRSIVAAGQIIDMLPMDDDEVLIQTYGYGIEGEFNVVYRMDVRSGKVRKVAGSPVRNGTFRTDSEHRVAVVAGEDRQGNNQVFYRASDERDWELLASSAMGKGYLWPVAPSGQKDEFIVYDDRDAPTRGIYSWAPASRTQRLLFRHPEVNVALEGVDPTGKPWGFWYLDHFPRYWYPDPKQPLAELHQWLCSAFPDHKVEITSQTDDMTLAVASISAPRMPPSFFVVDVKGRKLLHQLSSRPDLKREDLAAVEPIEFAARDGMKIRGYLTTPNGPQTQQLPLIVLVHGGPHGVYDGYDFDPEVQLMASRGYAVLQVNYRGSGGRGRDFEAAGYGRWGREMQDDITDGVRWAISDGVADAKRICIYGGSFGAYAALTALFREPDLFRCAVGMAGIYDLPLMFEKGDVQTVESGVNYMKMVVGTDMEELKRRSPVYNADKIRAPVLLLHGKIDERAPFEHAKRMRHALEKAGNPPEWATEWGEGHGFFNETNRVAAYEQILSFFAKYLGMPQGPDRP
jgi:dipeptidyl aminopeptidase/acylaminoacyl peptidase